MNKDINLVMITDARYILTTIVAIRSIVKHINASCFYKLYIIADKNVQKTWEDEYSDEKYPDNFELIFVNESIEIENLSFEHLYVSKAALLKFWIPELLPQLNKVLYIDGDVMVQDDLEELFNIDVSKYYAAAVKDMATYDDNYPDLIGIQEYFNSGVMLLNLSELRKNNVCEKLIEEKKCQKYQRFMDQDAFNLAFKDKVLFISPIYNYMPVILRNHSMDEYKAFYQITEQELGKIQIIHLAGEIKPWDTAKARYFEQWFAYLKDNREVSGCLGRYFKSDFDTLWGHTDDLAETLDKNIQRIDNQRAADATEMKVDIRYLKDHTAALAKENQHIDAHYKSQIERLEQIIESNRRKMEEDEGKIELLLHTVDRLENTFFKRCKRKLKSILKIR